MTCAEFQRDLPNIFEGSGSLEHEEHLRTCQVCSDLVSDLRYIAEQAKLLVPMEDPSPKVWDGITKSLEREGLVKPAPARGSLLAPQRVSWGVLLFAALALTLATGTMFYRQNVVSSKTRPAILPEAASALVADDGASDEQILQQVEQQNPALRQTYEDNLKSVNEYISDARQSLDRDPNDNDARQYLMLAMEQKAMLYEMAARTGN